MITKLADGATRKLARHDDKTSKMPLKIDGEALGRLRPDQMPRMLGAITHPDRLDTKTFTFDELTAIQNRVDTARVEEIAAEAADGPAGVVAQFDGGLYILDGHHRIIGAWLRGDETVEARFINLNPRSNAMKAETVLKVDESLGLVFGWAIVCKEDGVDHFDTQGDHIPEEVMLKAAADFMGEIERVGADMHVWDQDGKPIKTGAVVFAWPMTEDIAKAMGFSGRNTGLMIAYKPDSPELLKRFRDGVYTGFSIGGSATKVSA